MPTPDRGGPASPSPEPHAPHSIPSGTALRGIDAALDEMQIGTYEWDLNTRVHVFSTRCKRMWGFADDVEMTPEALLARVHPEDRPLALTVEEAIAPGGSGRYSVEWRILLPDGTVRWLRIAGQTKYTSNGAALRGYGAMCDITQRKLAEQRLHEQNAQMLSFVERVPVPIAVFDRNMRYIAASDRYAELWGVPRGELCGRLHYDIFPNHPVHWIDAHRRVLAGGATESCDKELYERPGGNREWVRWILQPWFSGDGSIGGVVLLADIITPLVEAQEALRASRARLELAIQASAFGIYQRDLTLGTLEWDARARQIWGYSPDEAITPESAASAVHPDDRDRFDEALSASTGNGIFNLEYRIINRQDGSLHWISSTGRAWTAGGHIRLIGVIEDVTERKRAEQALEQLTLELRRADEYKNLYLATLSHELRNPLAPIRTAAHLLASPRLPARDLRWISQLIQRQTAHMASLLEDLLEITRISRGKLTLRKQQTSLSAITQLAIESARPLIDEKHHELRVDVPTDPVAVYADPARLSQVLSNLLTNAAKYTAARGRVEPSARVEYGLLVIRVRDNGMGIPAKDLDKIFKLFWQADSDAGRARGGLGIGLSFVQGIVQLHGGTIEAKSDGPGLGSEFIVRLPRVQSTVSAQALTGSTGPALPAREAAREPTREPMFVAGGPHRILVADDDSDTAETLRMLLTLSGHDVRVAHSGPEALDAADSFHPDVALLDLSMPGLDGYGVATALREEPWARQLRLIALSGWAQPDDQRRARASGFDEQLIKPVDPERLRQLLH